MGITVRQALNVEALREAKVVAGYQGLDNVINFVNIMEVPEVTKWMKGGELLVTAGFALQDSGKERRRLVYDLAAKGVAAFGIKPGQYFQTIPEDMLEYANEVGMPLIELPGDIPYMDFMVPLFEILISDQLARLKKSEQIHNRLLEIVLNSNGLPSVCHTLVELAGNPVLIVNGKGDLIASAWPPQINGCSWERSEENVLAELEKEKLLFFSLNPHRWHRFQLQMEGHTQPLVIVRIDINGNLHGFLVILETHRVLDNQDVMAVEHASTIVALEFLKQKIVYDTEKQIRVELLEDLISGNFRFEDDVIRRAGHLNFNLASRTVVFVIHIDLFNDKGHNDTHVHQLREEFVQFTHRILQDFPGGAMILTKGDNITGLVRIPFGREIMPLRKKLTELKAQAVLKWPKLKLSIGVGQSVDAVRMIKKSYEEALDALKIASFMYEDSSITFFEDLGAYSFLFELEESSSMRNFFERTLGQVIGYDRQSNAELLKTLIYYFKCDCNLRVTAEQLYIHKNTVLYRIRKVEEITGLSMNDPEHRFNLQLCIKLSQVLQNDHKMFG
ncbi:MAG: PucR family transcriptional regulator [Desulfitobacteriaceae bacterium]